MRWTSGIQIKKGSQQTRKPPMMNPMYRVHEKNKIFATYMYSDCYLLFFGHSERCKILGGSSIKKVLSVSSSTSVPPALELFSKMFVKTVAFFTFLLPVYNHKFKALPTVKNLVA